jgi:cohesin complex subunit SCC1
MFLSEHILDPGVPIALRMSAHLLLGVVRIYSKKVDYLLSDCNAVRTVLYKVFPSVPNNTLPEDARQAPVHSITMPATFDLDMLDVDYEIDING